MAEKQDPVVSEKAVADSGSFVDDHKHRSTSDADSVLANSEGVTEHELATLRHVRDKMPYVSIPSSQNNLCLI
jgi:hypothetical protein